MTPGPGLSPSQRDTLRRLDSLYADPAPPALHVGDPSSYATAHREAEDVPNPCTPEARRLGCTCHKSPLNGKPGPNGKAWWFTSRECKVHGDR